MKYAIRTRHDLMSQEIRVHLIERFTSLGLSEDENAPDIVVTIGGDGTLLDAFHHYENRLANTAFVGIHTGHLGFYADWLPHEVNSLAEGIAHGKYSIESYPLIEVRLSKEDAEPSKYLVLNESTFRMASGTLAVDVYLENELFEYFRGDGLCVSTPTGSTAYNRSLGGAIIHPTIEVMQLTEMASINNRVFRTIGSSLILPKEQKIKLIPTGGTKCILTIDHQTELHENVTRLDYELSAKKSAICPIKSIDFLESCA